MLTLLTQSGFIGPRLVQDKTLNIVKGELKKLLELDAEENTRANAAAALGNLVRNSDALCDDLIRENALEALVALATDETTGGGTTKTKGGDGQSPAKIALFSLGNLCTHGACRDALVAAGFERRVAALAEAPDADASVKKYVARIQGKIAAAGGGR